MDRLRHQTHAQRSANAADRLEARLAPRAKRFVQRFPCDTEILCNLRHSARTRNVTYRSGQCVLSQYLPTSLGTVCGDSSAQAGLGVGHVHHVGESRADGFE